MSWWVKNHIAVNDDETKQLCSIEADTQTSLPAEDQTATAGFIIVRGSDALVIDTGDRYILDSSGTWRQQPSGVQLDLSGYATTQELTDGLARKVDTTTYTAGQAAQDAEITTRAKMDNVYGYGNAITSNSNLNDYTQPGSYYCPNSAVAGSLTNSPITNAGFRLVVESITNTAGRLIQTLNANGNDGCFYQRKQTSQGMSPWYKFAGTQVESAQSAASLMQAGRLDAELTDDA